MTHQDPPRRSPYAETSGRNNSLAIASLVLGLCGFLTCGFTSILAIVFGHVALAQLRRDRSTEGMHGMAVAGTVLGWLLIAAWLILGALVAIGVVREFPWPIPFPSNLMPDGDATAGQGY